MQQTIEQAAEIISSARYLAAFTGAGISVESGIPAFRGEGGIWDKYDPRVLEISWFLAHPKESWMAIRDIFYEKFAQKEPNSAHYFLSALEREGKLELLVTQNIDELHYKSGSRSIAEYHGNARQLVCLKTGEKVPASRLALSELDDDQLPPMSPAGGVYKPDFVFFGEGIPVEAAVRSEQAAQNCDVMLVIGSTGEVYPAAGIPAHARANGATIIEINPAPSAFTNSITNVYLPMKAGEACLQLANLLNIELGENTQ